MTFNFYLINKYRHFRLPGASKQSVHISLFFTPSPKFYACKMQTICFYMKIHISNLFKTNATVVRLELQRK